MGQWEKQRSWPREPEFGLQICDLSLFIIKIMYVLYHAVVKIAAG